MESGRVLILDDDDDVRERLCAVVAQSGYECRAVSSHEEALAVLHTFVPAVIIFEPSLAAGPCRGMAAGFRRWARRENRSLRIIMYTHARRPDASVQDQVDDCLLKPAEAEVLHAALRRVLPVPWN